MDGKITKDNNFRILIIDDSIEIHKDFQRILTSTKALEVETLRNKLFDEVTTDKVLLPSFEIDTALQGQEGVQLIEKALKEDNPYALAFVDIRMPPGWDGIETIKHIWKLDRDIQIVICTAYSDYTWEEMITNLGNADNLLILKKPFDTIAVRQLACALTRKWNLMQEARTYTQSLEHTVQKRTEELQHKATHDHLTGLANRVLLNDRLQQTIKTAKKNKQNFAVLFFDLDRFKLINDSLSHHTGDRLLHEVAKQIQSIIQNFDTLARIGGDEFVMIATNVSNDQSILTIAATILNTIRHPIKIESHTLFVTSSIGIAVYPRDGTTVADLLRNADSAMYHAKANGGDQFQFYSPEMNEELSRKLELEMELRSALENKEFILYYQPEYDANTNELRAVEALIRWNHPTRGLLLPIHFIPIAIETGIILSLGEWVLLEACKQAKAWQDAGLEKISVAVNITSQQLKAKNFVDLIKKILSKTKLEARYLELELSENIIISNHSAEIINALKNLGVKITIDDFGTGYSSLSYLRKLSLDRLKIDKSFISNLSYSHSDQVIIQAIIAMAHSLNLDILAEGVETQNQLNFLREKECDKIQGFFLSKPIPAVEMTDLLKEKKSTPTENNA